MGLRWIRGGENNDLIPAFVSTADETVENTAVETSFVAAGNGSRIIPGNSSKVGDRFVFTAEGRFSAMSNPTARIRFKLDTTIIADTGALVIGNGADDHWILRGQAIVRSLGVTGTAMVAGSFVTTLGDHFKFVNLVPIVTDTTISRLIDLTIEWGTASVSNSLTCQVSSITKTLSP